MSAFRKLQAFATIIMPVLYFAMLLDQKDITNLALWSSITIMITGIIAIATYDGPPVSATREFLLGRPPVIARISVVLYGLAAVIAVLAKSGFIHD